MHKSLTTLAIPLLAAGVMLLGHAPAQDAPAATQPSKSASAQSTTKTPAAKKTTPGAAAKPATPGVALTTQKQKNSYALGMSIGLGLTKQGVGKSVDPTLTARGLRDALTGSKTA